MSGTVKFDWTLLPEEIVNHIEAKMLYHFSYRHVMKLRLLSSQFAIKYKHHAYCFSPDMPTMVHWILTAAKELEMTANLYSFFYGRVYAACTVSKNGSRIFIFHEKANMQSIYKTLTRPGYVQTLTQGMDEDKKAWFKKIVLGVFKYVDRFYAQCNSVPWLGEAIAF